MRKMKDAKRISFVLQACIYWVAAVGLAEVSAQDELSALRELWRAGAYEEVIIKGSELRERPFGKTLELDYMLGTSFCRLPGQRADGVKFLAWCLSNYQMTAEDKATIMQERDRCAQAAPAAPSAAIMSMSVKSSVSAGAGVSGKMFHYLDGNQAFGATTIQIVAPKTLEELHRRRTPVTQPDSAVRKIAKLAGKKFEVRAMGKFVIASATPQTDYAEMARRLNLYEKFFSETFGLQLPDYMVTVYVVPDIRQFRELALKLHGFQLPEASIGYSFRDDLSLAAFSQNRWTGTLYHELFHLMARSSFGDIPLWLDEGMAALYEVSKIEGERALGVDSWRAKILHQLWHKRPTLEKLMQMNWEGFDRAEHEGPVEDIETQAVNHATARYYMHYWQEQGKLAEIFNAFRRRRPQDLQTTPQADALALLEKILQKPVQQIDNEFALWFKATPRF